MSSRVARVVLFFLLCVIAACGAAHGSQRGATPPPPTEVDLATPVASSAPDRDTAPGQQEAATVAGQPTSDELPVGRDDAVWGDATAPVTIVEFLDLECPFCSKVQGTLYTLKQLYGPSQLRIVYKHYPLPFHPQAMPAALAAQSVFEIAGSAAFFEFTADLFADQTSLGDDKFERVARGLGVDVGELRRHIAGDRARTKVKTDIDLAQRVGVTGTPNFRVNGVEVSGAQPLDAFKKVIDAELASASALVKSGVPVGDVFRQRVVSNHSVRPPSQPAAPPAPPAPPDTTIWKIPIAGSPVQGPANALVTIVEFEDLQCPFCKRVQATIDALLTRYPGQLRVVYKHNPLPFHPRAMPAAMLAIEARVEKGDAGFFRAVKAIFDHSPNLEDSDLMAIAADLGLNATRVRNAIARQTYKKITEVDAQLADDFSARGTPHFFINGFRVVGAQPEAKFAEVIDAQLAIAKALVAQGVPASGVYARILRDAKDPPPPEQRRVAAPTRDNPSRGSASGPIVIQMWSDFQCPFCKRVLPTLDQLMKAYPGRIRIVWRNLPLSFHQNARVAAEAALEAYAEKGASGFWKMHELLYGGQESPGLDRAALEGYAAKLGLDRARFAGALDQSAHERAIASDEAEAKRANINGTPSFVINGYYLSGAQPLSAFKRLVDYALKHPVKP